MSIIALLCIWRPATSLQQLGTTWHNLARPTGETGGGNEDETNWEGNRGFPYLLERREFFSFILSQQLQMRATQSPSKARAVNRDEGCVRLATRTTTKSPS